MVLYFWMLVAIGISRDFFWKFVPIGHLFKSSNVVLCTSHLNAGNVTFDIFCFRCVQICCLALRKVWLKCFCKFCTAVFAREFLCDNHFVQEKTSTLKKERILIFDFLLFVHKNTAVDLETTNLDL